MEEKDKGKMTGDCCCLLASLLGTKDIFTEDGRSCSHCSRSPALGGLDETCSARSQVVLPACLVPSLPGDEDSLVQAHWSGVDGPRTRSTGCSECQKFIWISDSCSRVTVEISIKSAPLV
ncbi:hypothetical protein AV530_012273 [Patagioenas fasciata monilis]|uniref:Uncharacterized protein n=1 Tax=Patagioenas fasciata monilis TaxID=372326 RepID=A0A1V4J228_PATFA|nr:hypothetical protein AV530_012273 [Patagioenas fasciata monilis]